MSLRKTFDVIALPFWLMSIVFVIQYNIMFTCTIKKNYENYEKLMNFLKPLLLLFLISGLCVDLYLSLFYKQK